MKKTETPKKEFVIYGTDKAGGTTDWGHWSDIDLAVTKGKYLRKSYPHLIFFITERVTAPEILRWHCNASDTIL